MIPGSSAWYSTIAFSVSISAMASPTATRSPGPTSQLAMAASVASASTLGIRTTEAISVTVRPGPHLPESGPDALQPGSDLLGPRDRRPLEYPGDRRRRLAAGTRCTGWSSQSKNRRWISSASHPP